MEEQSGSSTASTKEINLADKASYDVSTSEVTIPTVAIPNAKGGVDRFKVKLCPTENATLRFQVCDLTTLSPVSKLGDTTYDAATGFVNIPVVQIETDTGNQFYEVDMQLISHNPLEFEVNPEDLTCIQPIAPSCLE